MASNPVSPERALRRIVPAVLGLCLLGLPAVSKAANNCPWINEATASGLLGGDAVGAFTSEAAGQPAVCTFTQRSAEVTRTLRITVELAADPHAQLNTIAQICGPDVTSVKAIGNEAMVCAADGRKGATGERIVGRVRDQVFTITIGTTLKSDPILNAYALKTNVLTAAEQVSGNLF
jgi:hypothetical protein